MLEMLSDDALLLDHAATGFEVAVAAHSDPLERVTRAARDKRRAESRYRAELVKAVTELGHAGGASPYSTVAKAAGISRQAVHEIVKRADPDITDNLTRGEEARDRARLEALDATYEAAIDRITDRPGYMKRVTAYQNAMSKKLSRKGLAYEPVSVQMRDYAESSLLRILEDHPDDPRVQRISAQLDEAAALRKKLQALDDARLPF